MDAQVAKPLVVRVVAAWSGHPAACWPVAGLWRMAPGRQRMLADPLLLAALPAIAGSHRVAGVRRPVPAPCQLAKRARSRWRWWNSRRPCDAIARAAIAAAARCGFVRARAAAARSRIRIRCNSCRTCRRRGPELLADTAQRLALRLKRRIAFERKMLARTASGPSSRRAGRGHSAAGVAGAARVRVGRSLASCWRS